MGSIESATLIFASPYQIIMGKHNFLLIEDPKAINSKLLLCSLCKLIVALLHFVFCFILIMEEAVYSQLPLAKKALKYLRYRTVDCH